MTFAPFVLATALSMAGVLPIGQPAPQSNLKMKNAVDGRRAGRIKPEVPLHHWPR